MTKIHIFQKKINKKCKVINSLNENSYELDGIPMLCSF